MKYLFRPFILLLLSLLILLSGCSYTSKPLEPIVPQGEREQINIPDNLGEDSVYERAYKDSIVILAASDYQDFYDQEEINCTARMAEILENVDEDIRFDGFFFCGDVDAATSEYTPETKKGLATLNDFISPYLSKDEKFFVKGNHDAPETSMLTPSGENDTADYGVFVMNDDDYKSDTFELMTQDLIEYLNGKLKEKYDKPIFILSHAPMHYSMRTIEHYDGYNAKYYFDALNEAADKGLNIIFLYGHNHNNGWDDYLGGGAVFLSKGDSINICTGENVEEFEVRTLNFTYMNAGYVGYYILENEGACTMLSMSVIEITDGAVCISRITTDGVGLLKAKGVRNLYKEETTYDPDTTEVQSYFEIELTKVRSTKPIKLLDIEEEVPKESHYRRVADTEELKDGGKYLVIIQKDDDDDMYVMSHNSLTKMSEEGECTGFELLAALGYEEKYVTAPHLANQEWIFTKSGDGWLIGDGKQYLSIEKGEGSLPALTLTDGGDVLNLKKSGPRFFIGDGELFIGSGTRSIISGTDQNAAYVYIFEYVK